MSRPEIEWLKLQVLDSTRVPLEEGVLARVYELLEFVNIEQIEKICRDVVKISRNPASEGALRKNVGTYIPKRRLRSRPHRPNRKRGYNDKGSLASPHSKLVREINDLVYLHVAFLEEELPRLLSVLERRRDFEFEDSEIISTREGDYLDLSLIERYSLVLLEEIDDDPLLLREIDLLFDMIDQKE